jgi:hypothetical protein
MATIQQSLTAAFDPHGVKVRPFRASFHNQAWFGASNRIRGFYVRRDPRDEHNRVLPHYDLSKRHPWPTKAQVEDPKWLEATSATLLAELNAHRDTRKGSDHAVAA